MPRKKYKLNLALQGGGAHGAFTWGVLDRILEEEDITISGISGTSAGAMNAVVLVDGFMRNGRQGAKDNLQKFWHRVAALGFSNPVMFMGQMPGNFNIFEVLSETISPYQFNPFNLNPLKDILSDIIDTSNVNACSMIRLFITATNVRTGQPKMFQCEDIIIDSILASACIPQLFQAVEIDGEAYWDGGYMGNPAIWPLIYHTNVDDILLVQINPVKRNKIPKYANEIIDRINEITFNSSLIAEMRAINFVSKLVKSGKLKDDEYKDLRMHMIDSQPEIHGLNASSKMNNSLAFFNQLRDCGRKAMTSWLKKNKAKIGKSSSFDVEAVFLQK